MSTKAFRGDVEVPLPDAPLARAAMFGQVSEAWSTMLSRVDEIVAANRRVETAGLAAAKAVDRPAPKPKRRKHRRKGKQR
jgi:hypothetical protein